MTWKCKNCRTESDDTIEVCWKCGYNKSGKSTQPNIPARAVFQRYRALRKFAGAYIFFAWIIGIIAAIMTIYFIGQGEETILIGLSTLVIGALMVLGVLTASELIKLFIDVEKNTRNTSE